MSTPRLSASCPPCRRTRSEIRLPSETSTHVQRERREPPPTCSYRESPNTRGAYGAPRVHAELRRRGRTVNKKKVVRIMAERDIHGITRRKRRGLTKPDRKAAPAPDLVGRDFTAPRSGVKLVGDITFLPTLQGWWYLATVLDLGTREIIGYAMADHHRAELVTDALRMAASRGDLQPGCIMHSDRGSEGEFKWSSQHFDLGGVRRGHGGLEFEDQ